MLIISVEPNSPAQKAGLLERDLLVEYEGEPISGIDDLRRLLTENQISVPTRMTVIRGPGKLTIEVVAEESGQPD